MWGRRTRPQALRASRAGAPPPRPPFPHAWGLRGVLRERVGRAGPAQASTATPTPRLPAPRPAEPPGDQGRSPEPG